MEWTEQDIRVARSFDEDQKRLLRKIAVLPTRNDEYLQELITSHTNEQFGELMKIMILKRKDVLDLVDKVLPSIAKRKLGNEQKPNSPTAPR